LDGYQETPSVSTTGNGDFKAVVDGDEIKYRLRYSNLESPVVVAHIHFGQRHVAGGIIAHLCGGDGKPACPQSGEVKGTITAADVKGPAGQGIAAGELDEVARAMREDSVYANVHSNQFGSGEIRGQLDGNDDDD
jgi:CHRD domain-containing protein